MTLASLRRNLHSRHALAWVLLLALWLPAAQWAAAAHALFHLQGSVAHNVERPAHLPSPCDTCIVAAALGGAAPATEAHAPLPPDLPQAAPQPPATSFVLPAPPAPYRSRAPPFLHA
jgi:hypothetical protein